MSAIAKTLLCVIVVTSTACGPLFFQPKYTELQNKHGNSERAMTYDEYQAEKEAAKKRDREQEKKR